MRIAVLGDIHGNMEAINVAYDAATLSGAEKIYHLGDLGGYAPFINEVVDFAVRHKIEGVQGNYDEAVAYDMEHCGCKAEDPVQEKMAEAGFEWTKRRASAAARDYLKTLPFSISLLLEGVRVEIFHATPRKNNLYWHSGRDEKFFDEMARLSKADVMVYGHTHIPYRKDIGGKVFINAGSVGKPKDGDPRTCVVIIDINKDGVAAEFLRLTYDVEKTALAIIDSGLPPYFADRLREGR